MARNRRFRPFRLAAVASEVFLSSYENEDWDIHHNGEERFLAAATAGRAGSVDRFVALDVGSFAGEWARLVLWNRPEAEVHCFEVVDHLADALAARFADDDRVIVNPTGLWSSATELSGHFTPKFPSMSSLVPEVKAYTGEVGHAFRTQVESGDAYCERRGIERVNFMKVDVEGAEFEVLQGFARWFADGRIDVVQFEYGPLTLAARQCPEDHVDFFGDHGMVLGKLFPTHIQLVDRYYPGIDDFRWSNYVALRPRSSTR